MTSASSHSLGPSSTFHTAESLVSLAQTPPSPSLSKRSLSIKRKPPPLADDTTQWSLAHDPVEPDQLEEGDTTMIGSSEGGVFGASGGDKDASFNKGASPNDSNSNAPEELERLHSFPPQPISPATPSTPYSSVAPKTMSAAAFPSPRHPPLLQSTGEASPDSFNANEFNSQERERRFTPIPERRPSVHSQRSSIAPESVFGTAPVGQVGRNKPREMVRIERDYSGGELCQFWSGWIWELEGRVTPTAYQNTLNELNNILASAHDPYKSALDNTLAVLTLYLSPRIFGSHYQREMKKFDEALNRANRDVYNPVGLNILSPRRTAFLFIEIEYY
ncbi:hypothetical protein P7C70_g7268, partial [Phenoliferia sp. Uapishka_3]